jgi:hypothetical protein
MMEGEPTWFDSLDTTLKLTALVYLADSWDGRVCRETVQDCGDYRQDGGDGGSQGFACLVVREGGVIGWSKERWMGAWTEGCMESPLWKVVSRSSISSVLAYRWTRGSMGWCRWALVIPISATTTSSSSSSTSTQTTLLPVLLDDIIQWSSLVHMVEPPNDQPDGINLTSPRHPSSSTSNLEP